MVFITIPWFLPAFRAGGPIQSIANLIANFTDNVEYRIFCGDADLNGEPLNGIKKNEWTKYNAYTKVWYAEKENRSNVICNEIACLKPDVLFVIGLFSWHFNIVPMLFCRAPRKIISPRGMLHPGALTQKSWKKQLFISLLKACGISKKNIFHATDDKEEQYIKQVFGENTQTVVAGNFSKKQMVQIPLYKSPDHLKLFTIALISPMKNHLLVLKALGECTAFIIYNIYGPIKDQGYWKKCLQSIELLPANITVNYHGEVPPDSVSDIFSQQHVFIMPSKSENFGHAIAEALSAGKPVITSHKLVFYYLLMVKTLLNADLKKTLDYARQIVAIDNFFLVTAAFVKAKIFKRSKVFFSMKLAQAKPESE